MVQAKLYRLIHLFGLVSVHDAEEGFVHYGIYQARDDETGVIPCFAGFFVDALDVFLGGFQYIFSGVPGGYDLYTLHHRNRIHEMYADYLFRSADRSGYRPDG